MNYELFNVLHVPLFISFIWIVFFSIVFLLYCFQYIFVIIAEKWRLYRFYRIAEMNPKEKWLNNYIYRWAKNARVLEVWMSI